MKFGRFDAGAIGAQNGVLAAALLMMVAAIVFGGGTRQGLPSDAFLQLLAVPVLAIGGLNIARHGLPGQAVLPIMFCAMCVALPLLQLIPLPPNLDNIMPYRGLLREIQGAAAIDTSWWPISLAPQTTALAVLSTLPAIAVFLCALQLDCHGRRVLVTTLIGCATISGFLGLLQVAQGQSSPLRFYEVTNLNEAVGFFANRNHFAAFMYATWMLAACWLNESVRAYVVATPNRRLSTGVALPLLAALVAVLVLFVALLTARSRAGLVLGGAAMIIAFTTAAVGQGRGTWLRPRWLLALAAVGTLLLSSQYVLVRMFDRLADDPLRDARLAFARNTFRAAKAFLPFGSGVGTFAPVYALFEAPTDAMVDTYANRAHNDILEIALESGLAGIMLMIVFAVWLLHRLWNVWRGGLDPAADLDNQFARGACVVIILVSAHCLVDYPVRTVTILTTLGVCCALLCAPSHTVATITDNMEEVKPTTEPPAASWSTPKPSLGNWQPEQNWPDSWNEGKHRS